MEQRTVVRCAEGHVFSTAAFPMQHLQAARLGPGRLLRCPRCGRLRSSVPADVAELSAGQLSHALRLEAVESPV
ncbi:hypothetical protein AB0K51_23285 [Kitasatospora sp. NPDC049285]|uniref:hypothetical protein n=1 Tax=Kitasatospora sp. NPDC049285 TaxID=3157096 RepID=UPI00343C4FC6